MSWLRPIEETIRRIEKRRAAVEHTRRWREKNPERWKKIKKKCNDDYRKKMKEQ